MKRSHLKAFGFTQNSKPRWLDYTTGQMSLIIISLPGMEWPECYDYDDLFPYYTLCLLHNHNTLYLKSVCDTFNSMLLCDIMWFFSKNAFFNTISSQARQIRFQFTILNTFIIERDTKLYKQNKSRCMEYQYVMHRIPQVSRNKESKNHTNLLELWHLRLLYITSWQLRFMIRSVKVFG